MKVSNDLRDAFRMRGELSQLAKKTSMLEQGDISDRAFFVESGCLRLWHNDDGTDTSIKFFLPGELCASLDSFHNGEPSRYGIEAIVPSMVRVCSKRVLDELKHQSKKFNEYFETIMVHCMADYQNLFVNRISNSPEERYRLLLEEDPDVLEIIPLHYVASYLGVTAVSLSRIRQKVNSP